MGKSVGIDLGTTNSVVAVMEGGKPTVIANAEGFRTTPSVVGFTKKTGERLVGQLARRQAVLNPDQTVYSIKRFIGRRFDEVQTERQMVSYKVTEGPDQSCRVQIKGKQYTPEEISALVLQKLKADAEKYLGEAVTSAVITVPAYFNDSQRQATKNAGAIAGLEVLRIINEPTAAALAYGIDKQKNETILVFDLGGGTFDVSLLEVSDGLFEVKSTSGDTHLGGDDFDRALVEYVANDFQNLEGIDLRNDAQALQRLTEAAEKAKMELSSVTETTISLPFITANTQGPKHLDIKLSRARFDELTRDLVERCRKPVLQALSDAKLSAASIDEVVLVGGSTRIPAVQDLVKSLTGGKVPNQSVNPDEVVAIGAAIQAGVLSGEVKNVVLVDVTPLSLGLETMGGVFTKLVERNTTVPTHKSEVFSTAEDNQPAVDVVVFQGERPMARDNKLLGDFRLDGIRPAPRGLARVEVHFDIDANGILSVSARDMQSNKEQKITITDSTNLTKDDISRMVKEAQSHATEDRSRKEKADAKNEADALTYAAERQLADIDDKVSAASKSNIEKLIADLRNEVKADVDIDKLKRKTEELKSALQTLQQEIHQAQASAAAAANQTNYSAPGASGFPGGFGGNRNGDAAGGGYRGPGAGAGAGAQNGSGGGDDIVDAEVRPL